MVLVAQRLCSCEERDPIPVKLRFAFSGELERLLPAFPEKWKSLPPLLEGSDLFSGLFRAAQFRYELLPTPL
jgi:hypothetical protein